MVYGKLFKKYMEVFGQTEFSSNRVSGLTMDEMIVMAHNLYKNFPDEMYRYWDLNERELTERIFNILKKGTDKARETAAETMDEVRKAMRIDYFNDAELIKEQSLKYQK